MAAPKSLPARPSLESLRKQAKTLARDIAAADAAAVARARARLPNVELPLTQRNAQLVIAREYGFAGWQDLRAEVARRLGKGLEWAGEQARRIIHDDDIEALKQLLVEYPALLSWQGDEDHAGLLGFATGAYGDAFGEERERWFTRGAVTELLIEAGAVVTPWVVNGLVDSRANGLLHMFERKGLLPPTLRFFAALGDLERVRNALDDPGNDPAAVTDAFIVACSFQHEAVAALLFERSVASDVRLGAHVDGGPGRDAFIKYFIDKGPKDARTLGLWKAFVVEQIRRSAEEGHLKAFVQGLQREPWLLGGEGLGFQSGIIGSAALNGKADVIGALLDLNPALLREKPPPPSQAIEFAFTYGFAHLVPLLTRIWPLPDDLPHAAGNGDLERVKRWFDGCGAPALGDIANHQPATSIHPREPQWGGVGVQEVLDTALAWAVINRRFEVADFLLAHGANVSTNWNSHEPASILHHLVFLEDSYPSMQYLVDRGIDMTIEDYRWKATAAGWARYGKGDEPMARWLEDAERQRRQTR